MLRYGYFDSEIDGYDEEGMPKFDRAESSDFLALFISRIISSGVLAEPGTCFQVMAAEGMSLSVMPGFGIVRGRFAMDEESATVYLEPAPKAYRRIDRIVLRANYAERLCEIIVKTGVPAATPEAPELLRPAAGDYYELSLATVSVNSEQTVITQSSITDTRYDSSVCGVVTQVIDHLDTSVFFAQLDSFYQEFVNKSNASYEEFRDMAQTAYRNLTTLMDECYENLSQRGEELYEQYNIKIADYIMQLKTKGDADLAALTKQLIDFRNENEEKFLAWVEHMKDILGDETVGDLLLKIIELTDQMNEMEQMLLSGRTMARLITDSGFYLTDSMGNALLADRPICACNNHNK